MLKSNPARRFQSIDAVLKIVKKYLSRYDVHKIRVVLAQTVLTNRQFAIPAFEKKDKKIRKVVWGVLSGFAACALFCFVWSRGYVHKTLLSHWYNSVTLNMEIPVSSSVDSDLPVRAFFFMDDGKEIPEVKGSRRVFTLKEKQQGQTVKNYWTYPVYLRSGQYRIKIAVGPYVMWQTLEVEKENIDLKINSLRNAARPVKVHAESYDKLEGKSLTEKTRFFISYKGKWVLLESLAAGSLKTGSVVKILAKCDGYEDAFYSLILDWYQDELYLRAGLEKKASGGKAE